ncbi:hypothetical protein D6D13_06382 [Aureobasidium pullulans]|uniref:Uncharacterized protein n=1 Tax=Aureobasidium pullulans TaxID=5580 RepID=A0A4S9CHR7_AURPU|nr:hypothetical protein D6D13_06382 [Aureobasidium pullulans]
MATNRRINSQEKTHLDQDEVQQQPSLITPAVPKHVIVKLLLFSFAMIVLPISSYFLTVDMLFSGKYSFIHPHPTITNSAGNSTFAGATAAIIANVVLIGYVVVAMREDAGERAEAEEKDKKSR